MSKHYLDPKQPLDIEPDADRNVENVGPCCLDVRPKNSYLFGRGRGGGAWWMIWLGMMCVVLAIMTSIFSANHLETLFAGMTAASIAVVGFGLSLLWPVHVWKNQLPLRFNRKNRKVYFHWRGKTYVEKWDKLRAYLKVQHGVTAMGAPLKDPHINLEFHNDDGSIFTVFLMGVDRFELPVEKQAPAFWEYIRRYMEEGPEGLPEPNLDIWKPLEFKELIKAHSPFPILRNPNKAFWPIDVFINLPIHLVWFPIAYPTEVLYYFLEKHVKTKPFPPDMEAACQCDNEAH